MWVVQFLLFSWLKYYLTANGSPAPWAVRINSLNVSMVSALSQLIEWGQRTPAVPVLVCSPQLLLVMFTAEHISLYLDKV
jgi:hypothetical protein